MSVIGRFVGLLDNWSEERKPDCADSQHLIGSWAAKGLVQFIAFEYAVSLSWNWAIDGKDNYSYLTNMISDLGATVCKDDGRWLCSQAFVVMNVSFIYLGLGIIVAASLITSAVLRVAAHPGELKALQDVDKGRRRISDGRALWGHIIGVHSNRHLTAPDHLAFIVRVALFATGIGLVGIGIFPENLHHRLHPASLVILVVGTIVAMLSLGILWLSETNWSLFLIALAVISAVSAIIMTWLDGFGVPGFYERVVVYAFIAGMVTMGLIVSHGAHKVRRRKTERRDRVTFAVKRMPRLRKWNVPQLERELENA